MKSNSETVVDILKQAILLEKQGKAFYAKIAEQSTSEGLTSIFKTMADEEESHIKFLSKHFSSYSKTGEFPRDLHYGGSSSFADTVLSDDIKNSLDAASYEAAAISAAIEMEKKAVTLYQSRGKTAEADNEKELYTMLAKWELTHLDMLTDLQESIVESVWNENSFWPY